VTRKSGLSDEIKYFIVNALACFEKPSAVAKAVEREFSIKVSPQAVEAYDPTKVAGQNLSAKLREHFHRVRESFRRDVDDIPIASKAVRLHRLDEMMR